MDNLLLLALVAAVGINIVLFVPAFFFKTDKLTDFSYAFSFATVAIAGFLLSTGAPMHFIALCMVLVWASRLGGFLVLRIHVRGRDGRFDEMREHFVAFLRFWLAQGFSAWVILLSALFLWQQTSPVLSGLAYIGLAVFVLGLTIEATADLQKFRFSQTKRSNTWIDEGVWRISRHPNYLGEILVWSGMYLFAFTALTGTEQLVALASPLFIAILLLFISGIPILEKGADKRWGNKKQYQQYKKEVPVLVPTPQSISRLFR